MIEILNKRPEEMSFIDYKAQLKFQKAWIKNHKKGRLFYLAHEITYIPEDINHLFPIPKRYPPFKGDTKDLIYPI